MYWLTTNLRPNINSPLTRIIVRGFVFFMMKSECYGKNNVYITINDNAEFITRAL